MALFANIQYSLIVLSNCYIPGMSTTMTINGVLSVGIGLSIIMLL